MKLMYSSSTIGNQVIENASLFLAEGCILVWNRSGHTSRIVECRVISRPNFYGVAFCTKSESVYMAIPECDVDMECLSSIVSVLTADMMKERLHSFF